MRIYINLMTKKWAIIALFILSGSFAALSAQPVSRSAAISKAQQLLQSKGLTFNSEKNLKLADNAQSSPYYILRADGGGGFAIVSGEESAPAIIGYSSTSTIDPSDLPPSLQSWLKSYAAQIEYIREHNLKLAPRSVTDAGVSIPSQMKSKWGQAPVYNNSCPIVTVYSDADCTQLYIRYDPFPTFDALDGVLVYVQSRDLQLVREGALGELHGLADQGDAFAAEVVLAVGGFVYEHDAAITPLTSIYGNDI